MIPLLFTPNQPFSGKSLFCVGLGSVLRKKFIDIEGLIKVTKN